MTTFKIDKRAFLYFIPFTPTQKLSISHRLETRFVAAVVEQQPVVDVVEVDEAEDHC